MSGRRQALSFAISFYVGLYRKQNHANSWWEFCCFLSQFQGHEEQVEMCLSSYSIKNLPTFSRQLMWLLKKKIIFPPREIIYCQSCWSRTLAIILRIQFKTLAFQYLFEAIDYTFIGFIFPDIRRRVTLWPHNSAPAGNGQRGWLITVPNSALWRWFANPGKKSKVCFIGASKAEFFNHHASAASQLEHVNCRHYCQKWQTPGNLALWSWKWFSDFS